MEGIPRVPMISPEMKVPDVPMPQELVPKLREYILTHYNDDPTKFNEAFSELQTMRYTICRCQADIESLCVMKRYYAQMSMMKSRFPMEPGEPVAIPFGWSDRSDMPNSMFYEDVNFELCCVMFNISAAHATIAVNETRSDMDSIKNAFMHFQCAAWPLQQLRDELGASKFGSAEFEPDFLTFFIKIMLAQAQECLIEKSLIDHRKNTVVAKLAAFASEAYFELKVLVDHASISEYVSNSKVKAWKTLCGAKGNLYAAISRMYLGQQSDEDKKYGERLAHYAAALDHIKEGQKLVEKDKRESLKQAIQFAFEVINQKEGNARKENDFIYHEKIPKAADLSQVEAVSMVKPIGFDPCDRSVSGDDLFAALLPANVLKGVSMYSEEKAKLKRKMIEKIEKKDNELEQHLLALQLNQINLDQTTDDMRLPEELLQASASYTAQPHAFSELLEKLTNLASKSTEAEFKLNNLKLRLENIKCPQLEEDEGFQTIVKKVTELLDHHSQARINNAELQKALASQSEQLKLLGLPLMELAKKICNKTVNAAGTPEGIGLRKMVDKVDEMKRQRMALFEALNMDLENDDITSKILAEKDFNMNILFNNELRKHEKSTKLLEMNLNAQDNILKALTEANANFAECRKEIVDNNEKRIQKSVELVTAHQVFTGVREKTEAANTFFNQLFALVRKLDIAITGMEGTFKGEKEKHEEQVRIAAERAQQLKEKLNIEKPMDLTGFSRERPGRPRLADYMEYYRNKKGGGSSVQNPSFSNMGNSMPTSMGPNGPGFGLGGVSPVPLPHNVPFSSQEQPIPQNTVPMMNQPTQQRPQVNPNFSQPNSMRPSTTNASNQLQNGMGSSFPQNQPQGSQIPFSSQEQSIPQNTVSMMNQPTQQRLQMNPNFSQPNSARSSMTNTPIQQQNSMPSGFPSNQPQGSQIPFSSQEQLIPQNTVPMMNQPTQQRPQMNPNFPQIPQSFGQFPTSGAESAISSKEQPLPKNPSPLLNQSPQVNPSFVQMPQNASQLSTSESSSTSMDHSKNSNFLNQIGFSQINSSQIQNQGSGSEGNPSTGYSTNGLNGFQSQGQISTHMQIKQDDSNIVSIFGSGNTVLNQHLDNLSNLNNQGFLNQQFSKSQEINTVNQNGNILGFSKNNVNSYSMTSSSMGNNFGPGNVNIGSTVFGNSQNYQEISKSQNTMNQQQFSVKPMTTNASNQQQNSMPSGFPSNQPQGSQIPFSSQEQSIPQNTVSMMNQPTQQRPQMNPNFSQLNSMRPSATNASNQLQNGMGSGFPQNQPQGSQIPFSSQEQSIPQNTVSMMNQPTQQRPQMNPNFSQATSVKSMTTNASNQQQNSMPSGFPLNQPQGSQNTVPMMNQPTQQRPQVNPNFSQPNSTRPSMTNTPIQQQNSMSSGFFPNQQVSQIPLNSNVMSSNPEMTKSMNNGTPTPSQSQPNQKYSITPSPYAGYASKKTPTGPVLKDSPWHKNLPPQCQKSTSTSQSGYVSPFAPQNRQQNPSPFQPIQPAPPQTVTYFSENNEGNNEYKKEEKSKDLTQELLDNLFGPPKPLNLSKPPTAVPIQPVTPMVLQDPPRPAATVLPIRRPDGSWTGESGSNTILSFTNVQSVSHSDTEGRNSRTGI